jgi:hypothetical protein
MTSRLFFAQVNRAFDADGAVVPGAYLRVYDNNTTNLAPIYSDIAGTIALAQPVQADAYGVFVPVYVAGSDAVRTAMFAPDPDDFELVGPILPGYPMDDIVPLSAETTGAASIPVTPTAALPGPTVQDALQQAAALSTDQTDVIERALTVWTTAGTGNAYTITPSPAISGYGTTQFFMLKIDRANTDVSTLNVNALGASPLKRLNHGGSATALTSGQLQPGMIVPVWWDGVQFLLALPDLPITGSDSNGHWRKTSDGVLEVWKDDFTLPYVSTVTLSATWTLPGSHAFSVAAPARVALPFAAANYTDVSSTDMTAGMSVAGTTSIVIGTRRLSGATNFPVTASIANVHLHAIGRWF